MKIKYILILLLSNLLLSCDGLLDIKPADRNDLTISSTSDAEGLLLGVYFSVFREWHQNLLSDLPQSAGELYQKNNIPNRVFNYRPSMRIGNDGGASNYWYIGYNAIARANFIIDNIDKVDIATFRQGSGSKSRKDEIVGEARFLRSYVYYHLTKLFGDVPLLTHFPTTSDPGANDIARSPIADVRKIIYEDLLFAEENLPINHNNVKAFSTADELGRISNTKGRATKGAALLMLAKLYAEDQKWQEVVNAVSKLESLGQYELEKDFNKIFDLLGGQNSVESIWEIQTEALGFSNQGGYIFRVGNPNLLSAPPQFFNLFEGSQLDPKDYRQAVSMRMVTPSDPNTLIAAYKQIPRNASGAVVFDNPSQFVLLRLADALLLKAEALNELNYPNQEALDIINTLRARTSGTYLNVVYPGVNSVEFISFGNKENFRAFIREERERELMFEGHSFYDLLRYDSYDNGDRALKATNLHPSSPGGGDNPGKLLVPIPNKEIEINKKLVQNPAYL